MRVSEVVCNRAMDEFLTQAVSQARTDARELELKNASSVRIHFASQTSSPQTLFSSSRSIPDVQENPQTISYSALLRKYESAITSFAVDSNERKDSAYTISPPPLERKQRDWNEDWQQIVKQIYEGGFLLDPLARRDAHALLQEFDAYCQAIAIRIVGELHLPDRDKTVPVVEGAYEWGGVRFVQVPSTHFQTGSVVGHGRCRCGRPQRIPNYVGSCSSTSPVTPCSSLDVVGIERTLLPMRGPRPHLLLPEHPGHATVRNQRSAHIFSEIFLRSGRWRVP